MLAKITDKLITKYQPDRIILFGSRALRRPPKHSDIDLLIIKETKKRPIDRRIEVEKLFSDRSVPLDIFVYTPAEVRRLYALGSPFIGEVIDKGKVLYMRKATEAWIKEGREEMESAILLFQHGKYRTALYHCQQCAEKSLKAILIEHGKKPAKTHDLVELLNRANKLGFDSGLFMDDAVFLNSIYKGRYPTEEGLLPHGEPTREDTQKGVACAQKVTARISALTLRQEKSATNKRA